VTRVSGPLAPDQDRGFPRRRARELTSVRATLALAGTRASATAAAQATSRHTAHATVRRATSARDGLLALKLPEGCRGERPASGVAQAHTVRAGRGRPAAAVAVAAGRRVGRTRGGPGAISKLPHLSFPSPSSGTMAAPIIFHHSPK
jgi:hypothetical protein